MNDASEYEKKITNDAIQELRHHGTPFDRIIIGVIGYHMSQYKVQLSYEQIERICEAVKSALPKSSGPASVPPPAI